MERTAEFIQLTERLLSHVEAQQETIRQMQSELTAHGAALCEMLAVLRKSGDAPAAGPPVSAPNGHEPAPDRPDADHSPGGGERRLLPRRKGNPVAVLLCHPQGAMPAFQGTVIDRSPDGLCLLVDQEVPAGALLKVRPAHDFVGSSWFGIEVRSCRSEMRVWILGCRFTQRLSWSNLRLFG